MLTSLDFIAKGQVFPPKSELPRLQNYDENKKLFEGDHHLVYRDVLKKLRDRNTKNAHTVEIILNYHKRLTTVWLNLLTGEQPKFKSDESSKQEWLDSFILQNNLQEVLQEIIIDVSRFGVGLFKVRYDEEAGGAVIESLSPSVWFPVFSSKNNKKIIAHVTATISEEITEGFPFGKRNQKVITFEIEEIGKPFITIKKFKYNPQDGIDGGKIGDSIDDNENGIQKPKATTDFLIFPAHNLKTSDKNFGFDDYKDIDTIIREIELRFCQISKILDKHSDPTIIAPYSMLEKDPETGMTVVKKDDFILLDGEEKIRPEYMTWDGQLKYNFDQIEKLLEQLYIITETSSSLFGDNKTGNVESGSARKLILISPISKVARLRNSLDISLKKAIYVASSLDSINLIPQIEWQDGIPGDPLEDAQIEQIRLGGQKNTSVISSIMRLNSCSREEAEAEYEQIKEEDSVMTPDINVNPTDSSNPNDDSSQNAQ